MKVFRAILLVLQVLLVLGAIGLQVAIACFPAITQVGRQIKDNPNGKELLDQVTYVIGLQFAILTAGLMGYLLLETIKAFPTVKEQASEIADRLTRHFPRIVVKPLPAPSFYNDFLHCISKATHTVKISYLDIEPPSPTDQPYKIDYYARVMDKMKGRPEISFKRIVRRSNQNIPWVAGLVRELSGKPNNSVALIDDSSTDSIPMALSVQVVDNNKVWFVAIASHHQDGEYRDLHIEDEIAGRMMNIYYDRLWDRATKLLENGKITPKGEDYLRNKSAMGG